MRISAKGEYAIKAMLDLALQRERGLIPIQEIAERQSIPQRYLEQVLLSLKRAGLLTSKRGSTGGYHLTRDPEDITVGAVRQAHPDVVPAQLLRPVFFHDHDFAVLEHDEIARLRLKRDVVEIIRISVARDESPHGGHGAAAGGARRHVRQAHHLAVD